MKIRLLLCASVLLLAVLAASCAVNDGTERYRSSYAPPPPSAARMGLPAEYRVFYDDLADEGDWVLIEPYGYCFRPRVNYVSWRPYQEGWWEPSDYYGWVWTSTESFGPITYHYGSWFYDEFQGWVWQPGMVWGPAWVAWVAADDYVGWAPLAPGQYNSFDLVPGGVFTYARANQFATRDVGTQAMYVDRLPLTVASLKDITNLGYEKGVAFNKGPDLLTLQHMGALVTDQADVSTLPRIKTAVAPHASESELLARTSRLHVEAVRELRALREQGKTPPPVPSHLPPPPPPLPPQFKPRVTPAPAAHDTTHAHKHPRAPADTTHVKKKPAAHPRAVADTTSGR